MENTSGNKYHSDRELAQKHLSYLGYKPNEAYLRFFYHSSDPRKNTDTGRKENRLDFDRIEEYQSDGRGVYVVVNGAGGGHSDADIKQCCAIFCEWDDLPLDEQFEKWSSIGFVEPTFTVYSGDKSMQPYWVFDEPIAVEQWRELQILLIEVMGADKSNKNPSRMLRLAGGWHVKPGREPVKTEIVGESGVRYSYGELCSRLLELQPSIAPQVPAPMLAKQPMRPSSDKPERYKDISVPVPMPISALCALGKSKEFLGGTSTLRNTSMATLARDLIGVQTAFVQLGQATNDDAYSIFIDACRRCSSGGGWGEREWEQIWASAVRSNPSASILQASPDAVENCIKGEYWRSIRGSQKPIEKNLGQNATERFATPKTEISDVAKLEAEIDELLAADLRTSQIHIGIVKLAQKYRLGSKDIWRIYHSRESEIEQEESIEDTAIEVARLLASNSASVKLSEIFPESLAAPIEEVARRMNLKPECYALALISGISRFLKNGSSTMLVEEWNRYRCRTYSYFGALIAESSQMKTPVLNAMITDPLAAMRQRNREKFEAQEKAYTEELERWKHSKDENKGPAPDTPVETIPYITKATWEGIAGMVGRNPSQGILWLCDELAGFFKSANQYRSGKGSDQEDLLECWSGNGAVVARAAGTTVNVGAVSLSIYGNIQPKVLAPFLGDGSDDNGTFARFDFVQQPPALTQIVLGLSKIDINPMLQALYEKVDTIPVMEFELDEEAKKLFAKYYNHCHKLRMDNPKQGMRAMLGKAAEKVGRVATILHCIHASHLGVEVSPSIPIERVAAAIKWVEYTTQQALSLNLEMCSASEIAPNLAKIASLADRKGGTVSAREIRDSFNSKYRPAVQQIREWFAQLVSMGYGQIAQLGKTLSFIKRPERPTFSQEPLWEKFSGVPTNVKNNVQNASKLDVVSEGSHGGAMAYRPASHGLVSESNSPAVQSTESDRASETSNLDNVGRYSGRESGLPKSAPAEASGSKLDVVDVPVTKDATEDSDSEELVSFIRTAIAEGDRTVARDIQNILKEVCNNGGADGVPPSPVLRVKVWSMLTEAEKIAFTALLADEKSQELEHPKQTPLIDPIDAEKIRDIALIWWNEFYPDQLQSLIVQMFRRLAPGTKYDVATIRRWLEREAADVSDRIGQLFALKNGSKTDKTP